MFDCIIMNPPYSGSLHLQILQEALKHADNVVNLSPVRWLQDPFAIKNFKPRSDYKLFTELRHHIKHIDIVENVRAINVFNGAGAGTDLGIYTMSKDRLDEPYEAVIDERKMSFLDKVIFPIYRKHRNSILTFAKKEPDGNHFVTLPAVHGNFGKKDWPEVISKNPEYSRQLSRGSRALYLSFDTENEAENCRLSLMTKFVKFCHLLVKNSTDVIRGAIPFMDNLNDKDDSKNYVNPRTGKKGYKGEWTDADFYKFFNLTPEEIKIVEETMKDYE